ncbi:MAG: lytic polysaccharide monooxygenase [Polyangiaceae bacterium]|nr:lytic polysaccharide monooxygenase [Polyangiaceae bacterium]
MYSRLFAIVTGLSIAFVTSNASAHALLMNPPPLTSDDNAKSGPCGCFFGAGPEDPNEDATASACPADYKSTPLVAGSKLQVTWKETVNHTGKFRISLSTKPINLVTRADLDGAVLYEGDDTNGVNGGLISTTITVPDTPCTNCVIQLRQFMAGASKPYYYSCAAIDIESPSGSSSSSSGGASSSSGGGGMGGAGGTGGTGGTDEDFVIGAGPAPIPATQVPGACHASASNVGSSTSSWATLAGLFVLTMWRRSRCRAQA